MATMEEKIMALQEHYQNVEIKEDGNDVVVKLIDAKLTPVSLGIGILLPITKNFEIRNASSLGFNIRHVTEKFLHDSSNHRKPYLAAARSRERGPRNS